MLTKYWLFINFMTKEIGKKINSFKMYNPLPHLPGGFQRIINSLKKIKIPSKILFILTGVFATVYFLVRVIPKPSRAAYPCMQATAPFMAAFVVYLFSLGASVVAARSAKNRFNKSKYLSAFTYVIICGFLIFLSQSQVPDSVKAGEYVFNSDSFTPNDPIGEALGIFPGRVTWMWDPEATNESCSNTSNNDGTIGAGDDGWFMEHNNDINVIDSMITKSLYALTGEREHQASWDRVFRYFNQQHGIGDYGYRSGQKILLKINATTAYGSAGDNYYEDLSRNDDTRSNAFAAETNPYLVLALLDQLVNIAGVPEEMIYVGDPARNIYKWIYELWYSHFPGVKYLGNDNIHPALNVADKGRIPVHITEEDRIFYSDGGTIMPAALTDKLFTIFEEIDYLVNIPTLKAHSTAGITLAAKNHFGSFTRTWAMHLHDGLMKNSDNPERLGYGLYRVQTDIMMHKLLSGKNLFMIVDGLYPGEDALGVPFKWESEPFNNDWCSSIFMSFDPVAIESVCHDFLRTEYNGPTISESRPNWYGVDDYLHQAADSSLWPEKLVYDPDNDGVLIASLGVHEHWNDSYNKQYTRNLGTGHGIELISVHEGISGIDNPDIRNTIRIYPNPAVEYIIISNKSAEVLKFTVLDMQSRIAGTGQVEPDSDSNFNMNSLSPGVYNIRIIFPDREELRRVIKL